MKYLGLCLLLPATLACADWGRLFFSPEERAQARGVASAPAALTEADTLTLNGEITVNGKKRRWINGELSPLPPPAGLKVGQTLSRQTGAKRDVYQAAQE